MSQFTFTKELNSLLQMDNALTKGPVPRWQKKAMDKSSNFNSSLNSKNNNSNINSSITSGKTPKNFGEYGITKKTPSKTPKKSPATTPNKPKTPSGGDRFMPSRSAIDFDVAHYKMAHENLSQDEEVDAIEKEKRQAVSESLKGESASATRILEYKKKAPPPPEGYQNTLKVVYTQTKTPMSSKGAGRYINHAPERILDAPDIRDDYYLNLIDWSSLNILAVALENSVYLWNADSGSIDHLLELEGADYVCSVNWIEDGNLLAVGTSLGCVQLWDVSQSRRLRIMDGHSLRVSSLSWNTHILSSGSRSGEIIYHDVRHRDHNVATLRGHSHEVCGLKWSPDGRYLASGGNDNLLNIWGGIPGQANFQTEPIYSLSSHQAAVKAVAWCPWYPSVLASGGGTADRRIRFWNANSGVCLNEVDTKSQVCSIVWSSTFKELVSGHGFANNQLIIWKYPSLNKVVELTGHTARVLHVALSPDETTVLSAGADETLRMWRCFVPDKKAVEQRKSAVKTSIFKQHSIR